MICDFSYYEYKYFVANEQLSYINALLESFAGDSDPFPSGCVDSIYYDTADARCYHECLNGESVKRKFRIRGYGNGVYQQIHQKEKLLTGVGKFKTALQPLHIVGEQPPQWDSLCPARADDAYFNKIKSLGSQYGILLPAVRVRYQRQRYRLFDFRLTLDTNIEVFGYGDGIMTALGHEVLPYHVLEVKTRKRRPKLPFMGLVKLPQISFSKFYLGLTALHFC